MLMEVVRSVALLRSGEGVMILGLAEGCYGSWLFMNIVVINLSQTD